MEQQELHQRQSWLSLVAETAGVSGATVKRVEICADGLADRLGDEWVQAVIQVRDDFGAVAGAVTWEGDTRELADGVTIDVGCDLPAHAGSHVVGWIQSASTSIDSSLARPPWNATGRYFAPTQAMKLMLQIPSRRLISASRMSPQVAA